MSILDCNSNAEVLLVQPEYGKEGLKKIIHHPGMEFPYNLTCLSGYLEKEGISNEIFDWRLYETPEELFRSQLMKLKPAVVGITSTTFSMNNAARIVNIVKGVDKRIVTVLGGCHASALPEETLTDYSDFDYLIHGEGEVALTNLVNAVKDNSKDIENLEGLALRKNGGVIVNPRGKPIADLDSLPLPARHKIDVKKYAPNPGTRNYMSLPTTGLSVGRGCPYNCQFCYKGVWGKSIRFRSQESVMSEIKECKEKYGINDFRFYDDVLTFPKWHIIDFAEKLIRDNIEINWSCWSRVNDVNYDTLVKMKQAGCYHIKYGIEFGTEKALKLTKKGITLEQSRKAIEMTRNVGIECKGSFIFGIPGETEEDCRQTIQFALDISPDFATFYTYDCIPGSKFYEQMKAGTNNVSLSKEVTEKFKYEAYKKFYLRPSFFFRRIKALINNPGREIKSLYDGVKMMIGHFTSKMK